MTIRLWSDKAKGGKHPVDDNDEAFAEIVDPAEFRGRVDYTGEDLDLGMREDGQASQNRRRGDTSTDAGASDSRVHDIDPDDDLLGDAEFREALRRADSEGIEWKLGSGNDADDDKMDSGGDDEAKMDPDDASPFGDKIGAGRASDAQRAIRRRLTPKEFQKEREKFRKEYRKGKWEYMNWDEKFEQEVVPPDPPNPYFDKHPIFRYQRKAEDAYYGLLVALGFGFIVLALYKFGLYRLSPDSGNRIVNEAMVLLNRNRYVVARMHGKLTAIAPNMYDHVSSTMEQESDGTIFTRVSFNLTGRNEDLDAKVYVEKIRPDYRGKFGFNFIMVLFSDRDTYYVVDNRLKNGRVRDQAIWFPNKAKGRFAEEEQKQVAKLRSQQYQIRRNRIEDGREW